MQTITSLIELTAITESCVSTKLFFPSSLLFFDRMKKDEQDDYAIDELKKGIKRIFAPIIMFTGYEGLVTNDMQAKITMERLASPYSDEAGDYEALVYLHTASVAVPFSREWREIYTYLFSKYYPEKARTIGVYREEIGELENHRLVGLKKWIYKQQMTER